VSFACSPGHKGTPRSLTITPNDATGNGHHLTVNGGAVAKTGLPAAVRQRWGLGYDFVGSTQFLSRTGDNFGTTDLSCVVVFWCDALPGVGQIHQVAVTHSGSTRRFEIQYGSIGDVGILFSATVTSVSERVQVGLNRIWVSRAGSAVRAQVNDGPVETGTNAGAGSSASSIRFGLDVTGGETMNGALLEARFWKAAKPDATLALIANPADYTYLRTLEGTEFAAWFFEE
jgi:hypothetical protein